MSNHIYRPYARPRIVSDAAPTRSPCPSTFLSALDVISQAVIKTPTLVLRPLVSSEPALLPLRSNPLLQHNYLMLNLPPAEAEGGFPPPSLPFSPDAAEVEVNVVWRSGCVTERGVAGAVGGLLQSCVAPPSSSDDISQ